MMKLVVHSLLLSYVCIIVCLIQTGSGSDIAARVFQGPMNLDISSNNLYLSSYNTEIGNIKIPWIAEPDHQLVPICYDGTARQQDSITRLAHVMCRHSGFMIATKWLPVPAESINSNKSGLKPAAYCRGDEQSVSHCQWSRSVRLSCNEFLGLDCGDCSSTLYMGSDTSIVLTSPGFPVYIPPVLCEWTLVLPPQHQLVLRFKEFDLPSTINDKSGNQLACRSGSLDVLPYRDDINKTVLDGQFCGRRNPGNVTVFSSRILIRFIAGNYKLETVSKRGFLAECWIEPSAVPSGGLFITRWALVGTASLLTAAITILFCACKGKLNRMRRLCGKRSPRRSVERVDTGQTSPHRSWSALVAAPRSSYRRRPSATKPGVHVCDLTHWQQTRRLEKWRSARFGPKVDGTAKDVSMLSKTVNDSHIYEDIDVEPQNEKNRDFSSHRLESTPSVAAAATGAAASAAATTTTKSNGSTQLMVAYRPPSRLHPPLATSPSLPEPSPTHPLRRPRLFSNGSVLWPPSYFQASIGSGSGSLNSSASGIYINPEACSTDDE